ARQIVRTCRMGLPHDGHRGGSGSSFLSMRQGWRKSKAWPCGRSIVSPPRIGQPLTVREGPRLFQRLAEQMRRAGLGVAEPLIEAMRTGALQSRVECDARTA